MIKPDRHVIVSLSFVTLAFASPGCAAVDVERGASWIELYCFVKCCNCEVVVAVRYSNPSLGLPGYKTISTRIAGIELDNVVKILKRSRLFVLADQAEATARIGAGPV